MPKPASSVDPERKERALRIVRYLKKAYPEPKTELSYTDPFQLVVAVMLSAQCTDKKVNEATPALFAAYPGMDAFADADPAEVSDLIRTITFHRTKARHIVASARLLREEFGGKVPRTEAELVRLPGIAYKTAHVVLGELHEVWEGIPTDTHVRRFALKFDLTDRTDLSRISKDLEALVPKKDWRYVNNGLVLYGRYVCGARPHPCEDHPLTRLWPPAADRWPKSK
jgi:endonuclease-3